jgi:cysteinyl-tRNA synthetase
MPLTPTNSRPQALPGMRLLLYITISVLLLGSADCFALGSLRGRCAKSDSRTAAPPLLRVLKYTREEGDTAEIDVEKVEELIFQRSQHRQDRNFREADAVRSQLLAMGVTVFDRERRWFVGSGARRSQPQYVREEGDHAPLSPADIAAIESLLARRLEMRKARDFEAADLLRDELRRSFDVTVRDREAAWFVGRGAREWLPTQRRRPWGVGGDDGVQVGDFPDGTLGGGLPMPEEQRKRRARQTRQAATSRQLATAYTRSADDDAELTAEQLQEIAELVARRLRAKLDRAFQEADTLLAELDELGVSVSDDRRMWRADGRGFLYLYTQRGGGGGSRAGEPTDWIDIAIAQRGEAKRQAAWDEADRIAKELLDSGVVLDDATRTWAYVDAEPEDEAGWDYN